MGGRGAGVGVRPQHAGGVRGGEVPEEVLDARGNSEDEDASDAGHHPPLGVWNAAGREDEPAGTDPVLLPPDLEEVLALQHEEHLVLALVHVESGVHGIAPPRA